MKVSKKWFLLVICLMLAVVLVAGCGQQPTAEKEQPKSEEQGQQEAKADEWPKDPINIVVPYSTGGTTDRLARAIAPFLQKELGVPVVIENRSGGGGLVGTQAHFLNDSDDGSYLVYTLQPYLSGQIIRGSDFGLNDFDYLGVTYWSPQAIFVQKDSPYKTFEDLVKALQEDASKVKYSYIPSSWSQVASAQLDELAGQEATGVPYDGGGPQRMAVVSGEVDYTITELHGTMSSVGEDIRTLALFDEEESKDFPGIPLANDILQEMGLPKMPIMSNFRFLMVKKGFKEKYPDRWDKLEGALNKAFENPEMQDFVEKQKLSVYWKGPDFATKAVKDSDQTCQKFKRFWEN
ncbi:tripartite tricarboxylate transporter substrate binding protein [Metallumcola ferriviriculae]|uniref:Tripartite tricarboxylate transporter substrate binding protein n=1 Tax=Metallumcola ferriviriculae TaxID=3039180 RepID=A0AAU0UR12_9FIRM|nr:tripartite tricarboxylate transporter substrate binding protein [Desulfitibacteraceae bacterium MK1]